MTEILLVIVVVGLCALFEECVERRRRRNQKYIAECWNRLRGLRWR